MKRFSERYHYKAPSDVIIREQMPEQIVNAICSCYDKLSVLFNKHYHGGCYNSLNRFVWTNFMNKRYNDFSSSRESIIIEYIKSKEYKWYEKIDLVEFSIDYLFQKSVSAIVWKEAYEELVKCLNCEFERLNYAYRIVNNEIIEITSKEEICAIEEALDESNDNIRKHLSNALELYSARPKADYSNSIKESISAVEAICREYTGEKTLGAALNKLENKGIVIPQMLKTAFEKLYAYTNQSETGIRHALMSVDGAYAPAAEEALFMLVTCSSFVNYLTKKATLKL